MTLTIRPPTPADRADWGRLFAGYAEFYGVAQSEAMRDRVWSWLHDPAKSTSGLVAQAQGRLIGLAHFRTVDDPLWATTTGFLDDLFVDPSARGSGTAKALIDAVAAKGRAQGWPLLAWLTAADNHRARSLYDRLATPATWVTYEMTL